MAKKENAKSGKFLKKKKNRFPILLVLLLILGLVAGGWWLVQGMDLVPGETIGPETTAPIETTAPAAPTAPAGFETTGPEDNLRVFIVKLLFSKLKKSSTAAVASSFAAYKSSAVSVDNPFVCM